MCGGGKKLPHQGVESRIKSTPTAQLTSAFAERK